MDLSAHLHTTSLLSCTGGVTHRFTLLPDGRVEIEMASVTALVDPVGRRVLRPRGFHVPAQVMDHAATLARNPMG